MDDNSGVTWACLLNVLTRGVLQKNTRINIDSNCCTVNAKLISIIYFLVSPPLVSCNINMFKFTKSSYLLTTT